LSLAVVRKEERNKERYRPLLLTELVKSPWLLSLTVHTVISSTLSFDISNSGLPYHYIHAVNDGCLSNGFNGP